jgi:tol-pal system-associated acyl-CoA thioesterase
VTSKNSLSSEWHSHSVRIYYEDTDAQGIVYFANYQRFMERGRTEWLRDYGITQEALHRTHGMFFSVVSTAVKYKKPALLDQQVVVMTRVQEVRGIRVVFAQEVRLDTAAGELLTSAECVAVCIDATTLKARRLPDALKQVFLLGTAPQ